MDNFKKEVGHNHGSDQKAKTKPDKAASSSSSAKEHETDTVPTVTMSECFITYENGIRGTRKAATMIVDNESGTITITPKEHHTIFVAPFYPIVIEGPVPKVKEEGEKN